MSYKTIAHEKMSLERKRNLFDTIFWVHPFFHRSMWKRKKPIWFQNDYIFYSTLFYLNPAIEFIFISHLTCSFLSLFHFRDWWNKPNFKIEHYSICWKCIECNEKKTESIQFKSRKPKWKCHRFVTSNAIVAE